MYRIAIAALTTTLVAALATPALAQEGISSSAISRCAGKLGLDTRQHDAAFGTIMVDGTPWVTIERTEEKMGAQMIATTVTGTGARRRRDGTSVPFRFTCVLDQKGQAVMFHASQLMASLGDALPPATVIAGSATYLQRMALPPGAELRVQLLDIARDPAGTIMAEQVVRSGWQVPIPFALRLPKDTALEGRKLVMTARLVAAKQTLFQLKEPRPIGGNDFQTPIALTLEQGQAGKR
ncbi:MAG TPA: YbaY family lipoprotein [Vineibacter sp.]|nr:YbaY family lipoprotein [Vineibacter sp.]